MSTPVRSQDRRRRAPRGAGDLLRDEILDAATELLLDTGHAKAVSIRLVAERVGVTPPSIYLHFKDKDALLDAVCARYFEKLDEQMQRAAVGRTTAMDVLRALGGAYGRFAPSRICRSAMSRFSPTGCCGRCAAARSSAESSDTTPAHAILSSG